MGRSQGEYTDRHTRMCTHTLTHVHTHTLVFLSLWGPLDIMHTHAAYVNPTPPPPPPHEPCNPQHTL